jgi:raffinose/stachyose/melibiose transport system permease protein
MGRLGMIQLRDALAKKRRENVLFNHIVLIALVFFALSPVAMLAFNSVKTRAELGRNPLGIPEEIHLENFPNAWEQGQFGRTFGNSVILVIGTVAAELVLGGLAAYGLARKNPPGANLVMLYMLVMSTVPIWLYLVPLFFLWRQLNLLNSYVGLILIYTALDAPFCIFLLRSYLIGLPTEFEDAARVDGANELQILTRIVLPLTWPGFMTVGLVVGLGVWSEFQIALIFVSDPNMFPVTTSYFKFQQRFGTDWSLTSAAAVMMIAPVLLLFLAMQRRFIDGLTQGGLKV